MVDAAGSSMLSLATMEWLVDEGQLTPTAASPFGCVVRSKRRTTAEERAAAAQRELGDAPSLALMQALEISARPDARIRLTTTSPIRPAQQITLLRRDDKLAQCGFNTEGFLFGEPIAVDALVSQLASHLTGQPPSASTTDRLLSPRALGLLTALWPENRLASTHALTIEAAQTACKRLADQGTAARPVMDILMACGYVREKDGIFLLDDEWRPWLERLWSKEYFELEATPLPEADFEATRLAEGRERLLFVGSAGHRIVSRAVDPERFDDVTLAEPSQEGRDEPTIALSFLDGGFLVDVLRSFLRLDENGFLRPRRGRGTDAGLPRPEHSPGA